MTPPLPVSKLHSACPAWLKHTTGELALWLSLVVFMPASAAGKSQWPDVEPPALTRIKWVASHTVINGMPQQIAEVSTRLPDDNLLDWFRSSWQQPDSELLPMLQRQNGWTIIGFVQKPFLFTLQLEDNPLQRSGFLSIVNLQAKTAEALPVAADFMIPGQATLEFVQADEHGFKSSRTLHFSSPEALSSLRKHMPSLARKSGWTVLTPSEKVPHLEQAIGSSLLFTRNNVRLFIVISGSREGAGSDIIIIEETLN
jgi:hypothetical protein